MDKKCSTDKCSKCRDEAHCPDAHTTNALNYCNGPNIEADQLIQNQNRIDELEKKINDYDQTAKADAGKPKLTLVPRQIIYDIAEVREYGNNKYPEGGPDNWKKVSAERYRDAAYRHWLAYLEDPESVDEESGIKHLKHLACNIAFLCEFDKMEEYMTFYDTIGRPYFEMKVGGEDGENS